MGLEGVKVVSFSWHVGNFKAFVYVCVGCVLWVYVCPNECICNCMHACVCVYV